MKTTNRIHTYTRLPADPDERMSLALTDCEFIHVLERIGFVRDFTMDRIAKQAAKSFLQARGEARRGER